MLLLLLLCGLLLGCLLLLAQQSLSQLLPWHTLLLQHLKQLVLLLCLGMRLLLCLCLLLLLLSLSVSLLLLLLELQQLHHDSRWGLHALAGRLWGMRHAWATIFQARRAIHPPHVAVCISMHLHAIGGIPS